jgi:hypothetical protein
MTTSQGTQTKAETYQMFWIFVVFKAVTNSSQFFALRNLRRLAEWKRAWV